MYRTRQYRGYCSKAGYDTIDQVCAKQRRLWNKALEWCKDSWEYEGRTGDHKRLGPEFTKRRKIDPHLAAIDRRISIGTLFRLSEAYDAFFRRIKVGEKPGHPKFKRWGEFTCLEPDAVMPAFFKPSQSRKEAIIKIKGLPKITIKADTPFPQERLAVLRIHRKPTGVLIDLVFELPEDVQMAPTNNPVGIDAGVTDRFAFSNGVLIPRRDVKEVTLRDKYLQRKVSRRRTGGKGAKQSNGYRQAVKTLARHKEKVRIANCNDLHRLTTDIIRQYDTIAVEDLKIKNMTKSAKGTAEKPGKNVKQKAGLNRSILEQTWGIFDNQLDYKAKWYGRKFIKVAPAYTSLTCSDCREIGSKENRKGKRFTCPSCGVVHDADVNAAKNILRKGLEQLGMDDVLVERQGVLWKV